MEEKKESNKDPESIGASCPRINQPMTIADRTVIWKGFISWTNALGGYQIKQTDGQVNFSVTAMVKEYEKQLKAESWPTSLILQFMPKVLLKYIGTEILYNSKSVNFIPSHSKDLDSLIQAMSKNFVGCVHFPSVPSCNIKLLLLLYSIEKRAFMGYIPNDQQAFADRLRKIGKEHKVAQMSQQGQVLLTTTVASKQDLKCAGNNSDASNIEVSPSESELVKTNIANVQENRFTQKNVLNCAIPQASISSTKFGHTRSNMNFKYQQLKKAREKNLFIINQLRKTLKVAEDQEELLRSMIENLDQTVEEVEKADVRKSSDYFANIYLHYEPKVQSHEFDYFINNCDPSSTPTRKVTFFQHRSANEKFLSVSNSTQPTKAPIEEVAKSENILEFVDEHFIETVNKTHNNIKQEVSVKNDDLSNLLSKSMHVKDSFLKIDELNDAALEFEDDSEDSFEFVE